MKFKKILLPFDDSTYSINAAHCALSIAKQMGSHVTIINCYDLNPSIMEVPSPLICDLEEICKSKSENILKVAEEIFRDRGVDYILKPICGLPGKILADISKSKEYDLIIMGSQGHSDISGLFLGSVTHKVLSTMYCPVLVVP